MEITEELIKRKIKSIRHLLVDKEMMHKELIEETGIRERQFRQAMMGKNWQLWAYNVLVKAEKHLINRV